MRDERNFFGCMNCGEIFEFDEARRIRNPEFMETSGDEFVYGCPACGCEEWEEADECGCCGATFMLRDSTQKLCPACAEEAENDLPMLLRHYDKKEFIKHRFFVNALMANFFSEEEVNEILFAELKRRHDAGDEEAVQYIKDCVCDDGFEIADTMASERGLERITV